MIDQKTKKVIDKMTRAQMAEVWRFAKAGDPLLQGEVGNYFKKVFGSLGGMSPEISKQIGW